MGGPRGKGRERGGGERPPAARRRDGRLRRHRAGRPPPLGEPAHLATHPHAGIGQSEKLLAVWLYLPPRPKLDLWRREAFPSAGQLQMAALLYLLTVAHAWVYGVVRTALPGRGWRKGIGFGAGIWLFAYVFFELFTPFNLFGEPLHLLAYQLTLWLGVALIEGCAIAAVVEARER